MLIEGLLLGFSFNTSALLQALLRLLLTKAAVPSSVQRR